MAWYHYLAGFFSAAFLSNAVPHFVKGICGDKFPTPFSNPRGIGLSSAPVNVAWGLFNLLAGYLLLRVSRTSPDNSCSMIVFFAGMMLMSLWMGSHFQQKERE